MGERIYKTADGRYVPHGHADAVALAYSQFDEPPRDVLAKMKDAPQNKQRKRKPRNKSAAPQPEAIEQSDATDESSESTDTSE